MLVFTNSSNNNSIEYKYSNLNIGEKDANKWINETKKLGNESGLEWEKIYYCG